MTASFCSICSTGSGLLWSTLTLKPSLSRSSPFTKCCAARRAQEHPPRASLTEVPGGQAAASGVLYHEPRKVESSAEGSVRLQFRLWALANRWANARPPGRTSLATRYYSCTQGIGSHRRSARRGRRGDRERGPAGQCSGRSNFHTRPHCRQMTRSRPSHPLGAHAARHSTS